MKDSKFRVIIIGAGPTGLYFARALHLARIDFVVLERSPADFFERGNHVMLWPHSMRLLHQVGLYEAVKNRSYKLSSKVDMLGNGLVIDQYFIWDLLEAKSVITTAFGFTHLNHL
jgi:2-polyprenyl-6-methoxyphenol hydroxylase-like FAD-dependent oxidoreductase